MTHTWVNNEPITVQTRTNDGQPITLRWQGAPRRVQKIVESWEIHTNWWESSGTIRRTYYALITHDGLFCVIYHDLLADSWHLAKIYD